jgi:hypothetical protein
LVSRSTSSSFRLVSIIFSSIFWFFLARNTSGAASTIPRNFVLLSSKARSVFLQSQHREPFQSAFPDGSAISFHSISNN